MTISHNLDPFETHKNKNSEPLFAFLHTSTAGLGAFSLCAIPKDTIILTLPGPYASVVMRKWRKEVCAWCLKWRYGATASTFTCESSAPLQGDLSSGENHQHCGTKGTNSRFLPGLWHCSPSCLTSWIRELELWEGEGSGWVACILEGFEKALGESTRREREKCFAKSFGKDHNCLDNGTAPVDRRKERTDVLEYLSTDMADVDISAAVISIEFLDHVWGEVENLLKSSSGPKRWARATAQEGTREFQRVVVSRSTISIVSSLPLPMSDADPQPILHLDPDVDMSSANGTQESLLQPGSGNKGGLHKPEKYRKKTPVPTPILNELELDTAKFVLDGMIRKVVEQFRVSFESQVPWTDGNRETPASMSDSGLPSRRVPHLSKNNMSNPGLWDHFMLLQVNELEYIRSKPYMLAAGIKIYAFLRGMVWNLFEHQEQRKSGQSSQQGEEEQKRRRALEMLLSDLDNFEVVRAILGRDPGNVFGIWEEGEGEESEMYGWGTYVFGSFFNHDCTPNLKKRRVGRSVEFYTLRDVKEGDELSIAYVSVEGEDGERERRNTRLREEWFFSCRCDRCRKGF